MEGPPRRRAHVVACVLAALLATGCGTGGRAPVAEPRPLVGIVRGVPDDDHDAFVQTLREQGWPSGDRVTVLPADADTVADVEDATATLRTWRRQGLDVVVALSTPLAQAAVEAVPGTPVLFLVNDPVAAGLVTDPGRPEGSATGVTFRTPADRTLAFAADVLGTLERVGYLFAEGDAGVAGHRAGIVDAATAQGVEVVPASFAGPGDVGAAVDVLVAAGVDAVVLANSTAVLRSMAEVETRLAAAGLPAIANNDAFTFAVVVLSPDGAELRRQLGRQAARLLGGADVADVPVEDPRRFTLLVNRTTATELGLGPLDPAVLRQVDVVR